jgi:hypothetical protein
MINTCREKIQTVRVVVCFKYGNNSLELVHSEQYKLYTVKPLSIVPVTVVGPHVSSALFGPEISPI